MGLFNPLGQTWLNALILKPDEQVIAAWDGDRETQEQIARTKTVERGTFRKHNEQVTTGKYDTVKDTNSGFLVLTSQRLIWFERHGTLSKQVRPTLTFNLQEIQGIAKGGKLATWVSIADNTREHLFHFGRYSDEDFLKGFKGPIVQASFKLKQKLEQDRTTNAVTDSRAIAKAQVEMISCQYCEAKNASDKERCWRCGASLQSEQISNDLPDTEPSQLESNTSN
jgi:hypothetical protein